MAFSRLARNIPVATSVALLLSACGGGGGGSSGGTSPPAANRAPVIANANGDQFAILGMPYDFDPTQAGRLFRDPDGDALTYQVTLDLAPVGLALSGMHIVGTPTDACNCGVTVTATDGRGGSISDHFILQVKNNTAPEAAHPNANLVVSAGTGIDYDATQGGTTFRDPENQPLTYNVTILSAPPGFTVQGTRVVGTLSAPGFAKVKIEARDSLGAVKEDSFAFVVPSPISTRPTLPVQSFVYEDNLLPLNNAFSITPDGRLDWSDTLPVDNLITNGGATLGRVLFYDKRLSITNTHSCGSCHEQAHGFASSERFPTGAVGVPTRRSPMALGNVRFNSENRHFADERAGRLESLTSMPIEDRDELGNTMVAVVQKLSSVDYYPPLFQSAFGSPEITSERISRALAQFLRTLITYQSKMDRAFYPSDPGAPPDPTHSLTGQEERGFQVFIEGQCFHCHMTRTFASPWPANNGLDAEVTDPGTAAGVGEFRVASLRNIAVTGPYMHDGRFATLREVIEHYSTGLKMSPNLHIILGGLRPEPFFRNFSDDDKDALEAFFNTMTDDVFLSDPKFSDPFQ